ncbi:MAG: hypothetical protein WBQ23_04110 [Bacteroidota bacterium]
MKTYFPKSMLAAALCGLLFIGCGGKSGDSTDGEQSELEKLSEAAQNMATAAEEAGKGFDENRKPEPPVSFKILVNYLPKVIDEMPQENARGETATMGEWNYSQASADYNGADGKSATVEIFDYAYIGMMYAPIKMWLKMKINRESTEGYERTTEVAGFPAYEKYERQGEQSEMTVLVGDRFIITVKTNTMPENMTREIATSMQLEKLAKEKSQTPA